METTFIKYNKNKDKMLSDGIIQASKHIKADRTIWLIWGASENIRGYFFHNENAILNQEHIEDLMAGKQLQVGKSYLRSISVNRSLEVKQNDIVIDCFTGQFYAKNNFNHISLLIHLPWKQEESDLLQSRFNS